MDVLDDAVGTLAGKNDLKRRAAGLPMVVETGQGVGGCVWSEEAFQVAAIRTSR